MITLELFNEPIVEQRVKPSTQNETGEQKQSNKKFSLGLFSLPAPAIGAQLWERVSPRFPFQLMSGVAAFIVVPVWLKFKLPDKKEETAPQTG